MIEVLNPAPGIRVGLKVIAKPEMPIPYYRSTQERECVREIITHLLGCETPLEHHENGAPYLPDFPGLFISISHCRRMVAVAVSDSCPIGIDIEEPRLNLLRVASRVFSSEELDLLPLSQSERLSGLVRLWTLKEALFKLYPSMAARDFRNNISTIEPAVCGQPADIILSGRLTADPEIWIALVRTPAGDPGEKLLFP